VLELMGWKAEPLLLRRLSLYVAEASIELLSLAGSLYLSQACLTPPALFLRLLVLPLAVVCLRFVWSLRLALCYFRVQGVDVRTAINRMSSVHSRSFWSCSAATLTCLSCVLMVWHAIMFLLMTGYKYESNEAFAVKYVLGTSAFFVIVNWALWRDFVNHYKDVHDEPEDLRSLYAVFKLHKSKVIQLFKYQDLELASQVVAKATGAAAAEEGAAKLPTTCAVCLEDFTSTDPVAQLPCGHVFHPTCAHKWILEDWRCPFRCSLDCKKQEASEQAAGEQATGEQAADEARPAEVDVEAGR